MFKGLLETILVIGAEQDYAYYNNFTKTKKPNMIYRIYKRFNKEFRKEVNAWIFEDRRYEPGKGLTNEQRELLTKELEGLKASL